ncbi:MAG: rod shape-determining protein [Evtepia gabavorous]|uniref:rod shape-determining protein n=1 Tax=Evtepia gabavorous TaxID=2211183 RepID=UPI002E77202F|nr:rod shape-determining protein [Evtepia gabavorous]MEE0066582.1 rod shape-determining protein [Evtepia gabavorous]
MDKQVQGGFARDIAMDLGTTSVLVAVRGRGILLQEPSVVAVDRRTGAVLQVGEAARQMLGRTPGDLLAVRPLREGIISDCTIAEAMVRAFLHKAAPGRLLKPRLLVCVPSGISEVAERAVVEAGLQAGARRVYLMEEPLAAALGGVVASACLSTAGDQFDEALMQYIRQKHSLLIGARTAEEVKEAIGRVDGPGEETLAVKGRCLNTGLPREILLSGEETAEALTPVAENIISAVQAVLERTPPELAADVAVSGILLTGGGSLLQGMDTLLAARTGMETHLAEDPIRAVALGLEQTLPHLAKRQEGVLNLARRRQLTV